MKLVWTVLHLGKHGLEACAVDTRGERRKVNLSWYVKGHSDELPEDWFSQVKGEMAFQDSEKLIPDVMSMRSSR